MMPHKVETSKVIVEPGSTLDNVIDLVVGSFFHVNIYFMFIVCNVGINERICLTE